MSKITTVAFASLLVGLFTGAGITAWVLQQPKQVNRPENLREPVAEQPVAKEHPTPAAPVGNPVPVPPRPEKKSWIPEPGDRCHLMMPDTTAMAGADGTMYVIPLDTLSLNRFAKYVKARDGEGLISLLHQKRAVWVDNPKVAVSVIAVDAREELAEVRVQSTVYKTKFPKGRVAKEDCDTTSGVEAVVPRDWLVKSDN